MVRLKPVDAKGKVFAWKKKTRRATDGTDDTDDTDDTDKRFLIRSSV